MKTSLYEAAQARRAAASGNALSLSGNAPLFTSRRRGWRFLAFALACAALVAGAAGAVSAQRVYGVSARRTTVVSTPSGVAVHSTTVHSTTVVGGRPATLPAGYIAVLPGGYRAVGGGIYMAGGVRYRATFYQSRTVYIRL